MLQAVVDADYKYLFIEVGNYGHNSDGGTFKNSSFCKALQLKVLPVPEPSKLPNSSSVLPYFFISDGAYSLSENIIKPYPQKKMTAMERNFNRRLSRARVVVENAFGYTSQVFQIYYTTIDIPPHVADKIVKSTCVLHNMLIDKGQKNFAATIAIDADKNEDEALVPLQNDNDVHETSTGINVRKVLTKFFIDHPLL